MFSAKLNDFKNIVFKTDFFRLLIILFFSLSVTLFFMVLAVYNVVFQQEFNRFLEHEAIHVNVTKSIILEKLDHISSDLRVLSEQAVLREYISSGRSSDRQQVNSEYYKFSSYKKIYDQVRYIDHKGMERVRINYKSGESRIVPIAKLQNKVNRYYFHESFILKRGEIYVSPFDLNIEQGRIELPLKPMLRFGIPVFNNGNKKGVVVLNYLGKDLLDVMDEQSFDLVGKLMLINSDGYWLKSPEEDDEWGFMYEDKKEVSFAKRFSSQWSEIKENESGVLQNEKGIFVYSTIHPLRGIGNKSDSKEEHSWKIISYVDRETIYLFINKIRSSFVYFYLSISIVVLMISFIVTYTIKKKSIADYNLRESLNRYKVLFESAGDAIFIMRDRILLDCNRKALELFECSYDEIIEHNIIEFFSEKQDYEIDALVKFDQILSKVFKYDNQQFEWKYKSLKGRVFDAEVSLNKIVVGNEVYLQAIIRDVTQRKKSERKIRKYSETQAILLQEVNHRVKNNLAALISMLHMEENRIETGQGNKSFFELLRDLVNRIEGLATVHSMLTASKWSPIKLSLLCRNIIEGSKKGLPLNKESNLEITHSEIVVNSTQAHHLTLVINELTTNSIKHAVREDRSFDLKVDIRVIDDKVEIVYRDNGPGFPDEIIAGDLSNINIGFKLISGVVTRSLQGNVVFSNENGAVSKIVFPLEKLL